MHDDNNMAFMAEQQLAQAIENHIAASGDVIDEIAKLEKNVQTWNTEDIRELRVWVVTMRKLLTKHFQINIENLTDMKKIPTQKVPRALIPIYGIVALDKKGLCLYGKEMDKIAPIEKIQDHYINIRKNKNPE
jgi:hypothetical protein